MAMNITLRAKNGADVVTSQGIGPLNAYPDIISYDGASYVLKRIMPDKKNALYYEAVTLDMATEGKKNG
jgi:hypothetical protein